MSNGLKLGGTYRHYKTRGLYTALQLVKFEDKREPLYTDRFIFDVTFTGDGTAGDTNIQLYLSFSPSVKLYLMYEARFAAQLEFQQVLYYSLEHKRFFVRPLYEFVATAPGEKYMPRFELQPV